MRAFETGCSGRRCWVLGVRGGLWAGCARGANRVRALGAGAGCCQLAVRVAETGCRVLVRVWCCELACRCWVLVGCCRLPGARCVCGADWVLVPGAGAGAGRARSGDTPRCIAWKNWSCCQCRVQPENIFCMLLLFGVYAGVILLVSFDEFLEPKYKICHLYLKHFVAGAASLQNQCLWIPWSRCTAAHVRPSGILGWLPKMKQGRYDRGSWHRY